MSKIITAQQAADMVKDNDVVVFSVDSLVGYPKELMTAVRDRFRKTGHPVDITTLRASGFGTFAVSDDAEAIFCEKGLLKRSISSYITVCPELQKAIEENRVQGYMFPMGPILQLYSAVGRGMKGVLTKVGLGTFMDARYGGGKCNDLTQKEGEDLVEYIPDFKGEEYLWYKSPGMNIAFLRGTTADIHGNVSSEKEPINVETKDVALAVKSSGGIVVVQVEKLVDLHEIHPRMVSIPGIYVDYVVVAEHPDDIAQTTGRWHQADYNYSFTGDEIIELDEEKKQKNSPLDHRKVIARRAAMEVKKGSKANFGIGMPQLIPSVMRESGPAELADSIIMISETGVIGGSPAEGRDFGCHWNPEVLFDRAMHFSWFDGGNLDMGIFGLSEVDSAGDMNTSHLNGKVSGIGGFTDISSMSKNVLFMGTFTAVGLETEIRDGKLHILKEGKYKKFIGKCTQRSFVAEKYLEKHDSFLIVTERCVVECSKKGLILKEVAPGIDIQTQILDQCDVNLIIPEGGPDLMDASIFTENDFRLF